MTARPNYWTRVHMKKYARGTSDAAAWNIKLSEGEDMKGKGHQVHLRALSGFRRALVLGIVAAFAAAGTLQAQVPPAVAAELVKMGRVVAPGCPRKLYRPFF